MDFDKILIICNGEPPSNKLLIEHWDKTDFHIAADGGANFLKSHWLKPNIIIGDLDSLDDEIFKETSPEAIFLIEEQQTNDADKAVRYSLEKGAKTIHLLGAAGKRQDQFLANLEVMYKYSSEIKIILWTETERMEFISVRWEETLAKGTVISLLPIFGGARGVTTTGLAYPLERQTLEPGKIPSGVSNAVTNSPVVIDITEGKLLLVLSH